MTFLHAAPPARLLLAAVLAVIPPAAAVAQSDGLSCASRDWLDAVADRSGVLADAPSDPGALRALAQAVAAADRDAFAADLSRHLDSAVQRRVADFLAAQQNVVRNPAIAGGRDQRAARSDILDLLGGLECVRRPGVDDSTADAARAASAALPVGALRPIDGSPRAMMGAAAMLVAIASVAFALLRLHEVLRLRGLRRPCSIACTAVDAGRLKPGHIVDIGPRECRFVTGDGMPAGAAVSLSFAGETHAAHVRWSRAGTVLLRFDHALQLARVDDLATSLRHDDGPPAATGDGVPDRV
jgi:hypothetical protein